MADKSSQHYTYICMHVCTYIHIQTHTHAYTKTMIKYLAINSVRKDEIRKSMMDV